MFYLYNAMTGQMFNGVEFADVQFLDEVKYFDSFEAASAAAEPFDHIKIRKIFG